MLLFLSCYPQYDCCLPALVSYRGLDETNLTKFQLRSGNTATYPMYVSTAMLQRERVRSPDALEVLALLPRYVPGRHPEMTEDEDTHNRRLLSWASQRLALDMLLDDSPRGPKQLPEDQCGGGDMDFDYAYLGEENIFGQRRSVFLLPHIYIAGVQMYEYLSLLSCSTLACSRVAFGFIACACVRACVRACMCMRV